MRRKFKISHFTSEGISSSYYEGSCLVVKFPQEGHFYPQLLVLRRIIEIYLIWDIIGIVTSVHKEQASFLCEFVFATRVRFSKAVLNR
jgi:hypothetical protein